MLRKSRLLMTTRARVPIAFRATALTTGSTTVSKPAGVASGDLVVVVVPYCSTGVTLTTSSGSAWTRSEINWSIYGYFSVLFWKVLNATDVSNAWTLSESNDARACAWQPGTSAVASVTTTASQNAAGQTSYTQAGFTTGDATKGAISVVLDRDADVTPGAPSGFTSRASSVLESLFATAIADRPDYQGGSVTWTNMNGASTFGEVGWLLNVSS